MGWLYRIRQFLGAVKAAPLTPEERERVRVTLDDAAFELYQTMPTGDQRHSLKIYDALLRQGCRARPLLQAALLHDVAKRNVNLAYRMGVVVLNKISPNALACAASTSPKSWRHPFYISLHHPELSAELAARAGVDERALALIRAHQADAPRLKFEEARLLREWHRALQSLDDVN
ncbi:MAG TPA: hypothetical protein VFD70_31530 [Anaerolineae bacterium]|nr:hypothetical protein [Anaerolineae bacterium]